MQRLLSKYRRSLTNYESVLAYALLGIVGGVASGLVVLAFEQALVQVGRLWGVSGAESFETLPLWLRVTLPLGGAVVLGALFSPLKSEDRETGIVHVLSRMHTHYGVLPARNALVQFAGGVFALATGQSGGREGPGVHLGGAVNSLLGQRLGLPHNSLRVLVACGTAGGIAAAFNTPLAGVIFAMEVIVAEYTVAGFVPVMLAAVSASAVSQAFYSGTSLFNLPEVSLNSLWEVPLIFLLGAACGLAATAFIYISKKAAQLSGWPVLVRFTLAGLLTGGLAVLIPEILGVGYDTLDLAIRDELALELLLAIVVCKLLATSFSCGVGMPIGLIGPNLLIGACIGGLAATIGQSLAPEPAAMSHHALYVVIGMAATMGAVLNAPLAAILAAMELTGTIGIGMPALLAIVTATLINSGLFRQRSAHQTVLRQLQRKVPDDPLNQLLHRTDVTTRMEVSVNRIPASLDRSAAQPLVMAPPTWCLVERDNEDLYLVQGKELATWLQDNPGDESDETADLTAADIRRWTVSRVPIQATLRQAMDTMRADTAEAVCVYGRGTGGKPVLQGIVTRDSVEKFTLSNL